MIIQEPVQAQAMRICVRGMFRFMNYRRWQPSLLKMAGQREAWKNRDVCGLAGPNAPAILGTGWQLKHRNLGNLKEI